MSSRRGDGGHRALPDDVGHNFQARLTYPLSLRLVCLPEELNEDEAAAALELRSM